MHLAYPKSIHLWQHALISFTKIGRLSKLQNDVFVFPGEGNVLTAFEWCMVYIVHSLDLRDIEEQLFCLWTQKLMFLYKICSLLLISSKVSALWTLCCFASSMLELCRLSEEQNTIECEKRVHTLHSSKTNTLKLGSLVIIYISMAYPCLCRAVGSTTICLLF